MTLYADSLDFANSATKTTGPEAHGEALRALAADSGWRYARCKAPRAAEIRLGTVRPRVAM